MYVCALTVSVCGFVSSLCSGLDIRVRVCTLTVSVCCFASSLCSGLDMCALSVSVVLCPGIC